jgi:RNA polymerase sigma factor (sigma-70 family)
MNCFRPVGVSSLPAIPRMSMDPRALFEANLSLIDRIAFRVATKGGLAGADVEDFVSDVRVELLDDDFAILRQWEERSALGTFLTIIAQRLLADWRRRSVGRWRPSAEARREGTAAVLLERLVRRHGRPLEEALPMVRAIDPSLSAANARALLDRLPDRMSPPRLVAIDAEMEIESRRDRADARAAEHEAQRLSEKTGRVIRETIASMPLEDRMIVRMRFASGLTIASISRMLRLPQRPLYRRIEAILSRLRAALGQAGVDAGSVEELIGSPLNTMTLWKNDDPRPANETSEERWP